MRYALHRRKRSTPLPFQYRTGHRRLIPWNGWKRFATTWAGILLLLWLFCRLVISSHSSTHSDYEPAGKPLVVIVTMLQPGSSSKGYIDSIRDNRLKYAARHGYEVFFTRPEDYNLGKVPASWARIPAMRHALAVFPDCRYVWFLDQDSYIMDPHIALHKDMLEPGKLEGLIIRNYPVVPPDSIIRTSSHPQGADVDLILSQDNEGLSSGSMVLRNTEWTKFFLDTWMNPLYRSYNFQKAESHALEHIVQWHPTLLTKLALVPQRTMNSYGNGAPGERYQKGDFVVRFPDCAASGLEDDGCEKAAARFVGKWHGAFGMG